MSDPGDQGAALMAAVKAGDHAALAGLVALWQEPLLRFVYRYVQNETDARELVHETFVRAYAHRTGYRTGASFSGWIFTIAANLAHNHRRRARRHPSAAGTVPASNASEPVCPRPPPDRSAVESERVLAVRQAIAALPHELKTTLLLFEFENLGYAEIAVVVGCSVKGVEARLRRARVRLRARLLPYLDSAAALPGPVPEPLAP